MAAELSSRLLVSVFQEWHEQTVGSQMVRLRYERGVEAARSRPLRIAFHAFILAHSSWREYLTTDEVARMMADVCRRFIGKTFSQWRLTTILSTVTQKQVDHLSLRVFMAWLRTLRVRKRLDGSIGKLQRIFLARGFEVLLSAKALGLAAEHRAEKMAAAWRSRRIQDPPFQQWKRRAGMTNLTRWLSVWRRHAHELQVHHRKTHQLQVSQMKRHFLRWQSAVEKSVRSKRRLDLAGSYASHRLLQRTIGHWLHFGLRGLPRCAAFGSVPPAPWLANLPVVSKGCHADKLALWASVVRAAASVAYAGG